MSNSSEITARMRAGIVVSQKGPQDSFNNFYRGWSGGAMVLGKLPVPGRPTYMS